MSHRRRLFLGLFTLLLLLDANPRILAQEQARRPVDFAQEIRPIFQRHCWDCHGAEKQKGGLRLDAKAEALAGGGSGRVILPGESQDSPLLLYVSGEDPDMLMPPKGDRVPANEIQKIRDWIDAGAPWPEDSAVSAGQRPAASDHWAFQPIQRVAPPLDEPSDWARGPIDRFIIHKLIAESAIPSPEADRSTLIRRLSLDLVGLPPTPEETQAFLDDPRPDAYDRVVDRLLASPHHGERWGRHWLDLARYADSDGYEKDRPRPNAWRFRDWVIQSINADLPYDEFTTQQLAGDLLPGANLGTRTATGFHRNTLTNTEGGADKEEFRVQAVIDRVNTTGTVWMGLTVGCAQCHSHKYDPLLQREYYSLFAFFNTQQEIDLPLSSGSREPVEPKPNAKAKKDSVPAGPSIPALSELKPARVTHVFMRGDFLRPGDEVGPATPAVLPPLEKPRGALNRLDLARWLVRQDHPLTARVAVNRVWGHLFGRPLVNTPDDFGTRGEAPSHAELLDWLASHYMDLGWSQKALIRSIVTSSAYRQSSRSRPDLAERDPNNVWLGRQNRIRLEAEIVRDASLAASGLLAPTIGGPSVHPPQPAGISELTYAGAAKWVESQGADRHRRGLYTWFQRTSPYPMLVSFDAPDANACLVKRERSNTPLQALTLLNDATFFECAQALGTRVHREGEDTPSRILRLAQLTLGRKPDDMEMIALTRLHDESLATLRREPGSVAALAGDAKGASTRAETAAWIAVARAVLNLDEFITRE